MLEINLAYEIRIIGLLCHIARLCVVYSPDFHMGDCVSQFFFFMFIL